MSLNPLAPAFLPQSSSDPPISLCNPTTMSLPLAQLLCGMHPQIVPTHAPFNQHITDGTFLLPFLQPTNQSKLIAAAHQPTPESSATLTSPLQNQANCLQAIHKTIQQFNQHLKAQHLDRQTLQLIVLQLQNDFALLRYLLFSNQDMAVKNSATSPLINLKPNPNPNFNPNPSSSAFPLHCTDDPKLRRSTPVGAVGPPRAKTNNSANADFKTTPNTQEVSSITVQNLTSRLCKLEQLFTDEIATYMSITEGIHSQYFFLYDKIRQLKPGNSDAIIWKIPSVCIWLRKNGPTISWSLHWTGYKLWQSYLQDSSSWIHGYNFFIKFYPYGIRPATRKCASILFTFFPGDYDNLLKWPFSKIIHFGIRYQLDSLKTWMKTIRPDQDPTYKKPTISTKQELQQSSSTTLFLTPNSLAKLKVFELMVRVL